MIPRKIWCLISISLSEENTVVDALNSERRNLPRLAERGLLVLVAPRQFDALGLALRDRRAIIIATLG